MPSASCANTTSATGPSNSQNSLGSGRTGSESGERASSAANGTGAGDCVQGSGSSSAPAKLQAGPNKTAFPAGSGSETDFSLHIARSESRISSGNGCSKAWRTLSVSALQPGDEVLVYRPNSAARHMGHAINEFIQEQ
mmetsp:Transcript_14054/g.37474  ORF Transcript_14054/g.37474 Transcript_14054/m.37474 type:complete len:138 (-) Transcript_14054:73-486(-)